MTHFCSSEASPERSADEDGSVSPAMMGAVLSAGLGSRRNRNTTHPREQTVVKTAYIGILTSAVMEETSDSRK